MKEPFRFRLSQLALGVVLCGAVSGAYAHTVIRDAAKENTSLYTAAIITHGCAGGEGETSIPVVAQSILFPNHTDSILTRLDTNQPITLAEVIDGVATVLPISPNGIQDKSIFERQREVADNSVLVGAHSVPNVRALQYFKGRLRTDLQGAIPFSVSGVNFVKTSCVKSLKVRIAIANWCTKSQSEDEDNRVDAWIGRTTPAFDDTGVVSVGFWPTLTINRDLATNPLPAACNGGFDVAIEPSDADIDKYLPLKGYWPASN